MAASGRRSADPLGYDHPRPSMKAFAEVHVLRHDQARARHTYCRDLRLVHEWHGGFYVFQRISREPRAPTPKRRRTAALQDASDGREAESGDSFWIGSDRD